MVKGLLGAAYEPLGAAMLADMQGIDGLDVRLAYPLSIVTQSFLYFKYMFLWVYPDVTRMSIDMREAFAGTFTQWPYWAAGVCFVGYPILAIRLALQRGRLGLVGWLLAYPWLMFVTELSTVRVQEPFVLYRAYLWFPLFAALIPLALCRVGMRFAFGSVMAIVCILVALSWNRLFSLSDSLLVWNDAAKLLQNEDVPGALRIYYNRAQALSAKGRKEEALADLAVVIAKKPKQGAIRFARARIYFELKQYPEALADLNASIDSGYAGAPAYFARAVTLKRLGREDDAAADMRKSCELGGAIGCYAMQQGNTAGVPAKSLAR
jgi:hypothetical protein